MTFQEAEKSFIKQLEPLYKSDEAKDLAFYAIQNVCGISKPQLIINKEKEISAADLLLLEKIIAELKTGKPVQYIIGETEFYGLRFKVTPSVLIPRPETEELVYWILENSKFKIQNSKNSTHTFHSSDFRTQSSRLQTQDSKPQTPNSNILDIGTGSGCIAIALKKYFPGSEVYGMDISAKALEVARTNAILNNISVKFIEQNILTAPVHNRKYSIIVSNPPYITIAEKQQMHINVLNYEPHQALFVPDNDPLLFYNSIADFAKSHLTKNGFLFLEINATWSLQMIALLDNKGFSAIKLRKDLQGKDRMIQAQLHELT